MFGGLNMKDTKKNDVLQPPIVVQPKTEAAPSKPKDAWEMGKNLIKF